MFCKIPAGKFHTAIHLTANLTSASQEGMIPLGIPRVFVECLEPFGLFGDVHYPAQAIGFN